MKNILTSTIISIIISVLTVAGFVNYYPIFKNNNLGIAALTDITSGDTISDFPSVYTANNTSLENAINTLEGTTTMTLLTSAANLATVGTIATGVWQGTDVGVAYGGTGVSTLTSGGVLYGNGSGNILATSACAAGELVAWAASIPVCTNYFSNSYFGIQNLNASSTVANPLYFNGIDYAFPSEEGASSTVLSTNGSGSLTWLEIPTSFTAGATSTAQAYSGNTTITHGLGRIPTMIEIRHTTVTTDTGVNNVAISYGVATSTTAGEQVAMFSTMPEGSGTGLRNGNQWGSVIYAQDNAANVEVDAQITAITSTTFTIDWITAGSNSDNKVMWFAR